MIRRIDHGTRLGIKCHRPEPMSHRPDSCYADDGRLAANTELAVCRGVYAAGSVAKYANDWTGHATVAGYGVVDGTDAGRVAALNMAQEYTRGQSGGTTWSSVLGGEPHQSNSYPPAAAVKDPIPVWRSYLRTTNGSMRDQHTMLAEIGIVALCVGHCHCDSDMNLMTFPMRPFLHPAHGPTPTTHWGRWSQGGGTICLERQRPQELTLWEASSHHGNDYKD
jgi:hypothetical protein